MPQDTNECVTSYEKIVKLCEQNGILALNEMTEDALHIILERLIADLESAQG